MDDPETSADVPAERGSRGVSRERARLAVAVVLAALATAFAIVNLDDVDVNWLFGTWQTPLIVVIAVSFAVGLAVGWFAGAMRRRH